MVSQLAKKSQSSTRKGQKNSVMCNPSRHYVFTSYAANFMTLLASVDFHDTCVRYLACQHEVTPSTDKDHIQGYVEFSKPQRAAAVKRILKDNSLHLEIRKGTRQQARDYALKTQATLEKYPKWKDHGLRKEGTEPFEFGSWDTKMKSGRRTDLEDIWQLIRGGANEYEVLEQYPKAYMMYTRGVRNARQMYVQRNQSHFRKVDVRVNWGDAGTGKTRFAYENHDPSDVYELASLDPLWFDGYSGQKVLLINEFYGQLRPSKLLKLLDGYRTQYPVKGGFITAEWDTVIITSNQHPEQWYGEKVPLEVKHAIARRIDGIEHFVKETPRENECDPWANVKQTRRVVDSLGATVQVVDDDDDSAIADFQFFEDLDREEQESRGYKVAAADSVCNTRSLVLPATSLQCNENNAVINGIKPAILLSRKNGRKAKLQAKLTITPI